MGDMGLLEMLINKGLGRLGVGKFVGWFKGDWYVSATNKYTHFSHLSFENIPLHHTEKTQYNLSYVVHCLVLVCTINGTRL